MGQEIKVISRTAAEERRAATWKRRSKPAYWVPKREDVFRGTAS